MRASPAAPRWVQQEGSGLCRERPLVEQAVPLQPMGPTRSRSPCCSPPMGGGAPGGAGGCGLEEAAAHGEPPQEQAPGRCCSLWRGAHAGAGGLGGAAAYLWGTRVGAVCSWGMEPMVWSRVGAVLEELLPVDSPRMLCPGHLVGGTPCGAGAESAREGAVETKASGTDRSTHSPMLFGVRRWKRVALVCF